MGRFITAVAAELKLAIFLAPLVDDALDATEEEEEEDAAGLEPAPAPPLATGCPLLPSAGGGGRPRAVERGQRP